MLFRSGGIVNRGTVAEQLLYEIGDPASYILPDVVCDFTQINLEQVADNRVRVSGARGRGVPTTYKTSMTWADGWRAGTTFWCIGRRAADKARIFAEEALVRTRSKIRAMGGQDFDDVAIDIIGEESFWGAHASAGGSSREVALKVACRHQDARAVGLLLRELSGVALGAPAGMAFFAGARPKPSPVIRLFSVLVDKSVLDLKLIDESGAQAFQSPATIDAVATFQESAIPEPETGMGDMTEVPLETLAWGRSGDKGDKANIGIIARKPEYLPWIAAKLTADYVGNRFAHFMTSPDIDRYYMPGLPALNFLLHNALGGGGIASLRNDPQAKAYAQVLLDTPIAIPQQLLEA